MSHSATSLTRTAACLTLGAALTATGCSPFDAQASTGGNASRKEKLTLSGSSTMAPLVAEIAARFESQHEGLRIDVQTGGSSRGIVDAASGLADIGLSSRLLRGDERTHLTGITLARDGVCFIVHASNPVDELTDTELHDIYSGRLANWSAVGGKDAPITVISRAEGRSELEMMYAYLAVEPEEARAHAIAGENQQGVKQVATDPNAICFMSIGTSEFEIANGTPIKALPLHGVAASAENVASGAFPWSRPLVLVTRPDPPPLVRAFLTFATSEEVDDLTLSYSFVPAGP